MIFPDSGYEGEFVIHAHRARKFHWDIRIEVIATEDDFEKMNLEGYRRLGISVEKGSKVMWSLAVPKARAPKKGEKLLAIETEPHPVEYNRFEGFIPEGVYGAGEVRIYDTGRVIWREVSERKIVLEFKGKNINGFFAFLLFKKEESRKWLWLRVGQAS